MTSAEYHNTLHKRCPIFFFDGFISIYRETYFVTGTQCIYFMACTCSMKINFLRIVIVDIVDRNCIGISVISIYGKNATSAGLQKSLCRVDADFIFLFTNCSEHDIVLLLMLQMEDTEFDLISKAQNGECLFRCGSDRYMMKVIAPEHKAKLFGTKGGK